MIDPGRIIGSTSPERDRRILEVFIREIEKDLALLSSAPDHESWFRAAHGLKNSAAGVGANELMEMAAEAEAVSPLEWPLGRASLETALRASATRARTEALGRL